MGGKNRKSIQLAFAWGEEGAALPRQEEGLHPPMAPREHPPRVTDLMEQIVDADNMRRALKRVRSNKGAPGVDGMTVDTLTPYLVTAWPTIKASLLTGRYQPSPVQRVDIPKPGGGTRSLGMPTVQDRLMPQAVLQILEPLDDPTFSPSSYGFRPGKSAHQALTAARQHVEGGYGIVVDMDLEKFFDRVNHDKLMALLAERIGDKRVLLLIRRVLQAGMMHHGVVMERHEGTPQGGPLSPLLSNVLLHELDTELTRRGHRFCRYADDGNIYVRSRRSGARVMVSLTRWLEKRLPLQVNAAKSGVARSHARKFLGMRIVKVGGKTTIAVAPVSLQRLKDNIRRITQRKRGISLQRLLDELNTATMGWVQYFHLAAMKSHLQSLEEWLRRRIRCFIWKQWKTWRNRVDHLLVAGIGPWLAYGIASGKHGLWKAAGSPALTRTLPNAKLTELGLKSLLERYQSLQAC
jgi:RNA-directed DNA polymerase